MRRAYAFVGALAIVALAAVLVGSQPALAGNPGGAMVADGQPQALEPVPAESLDYSYDNQCGCPNCCRCRENCYSRMLNKWAEVGNFNCSCRGSYKFPVPPQYTYHWPGMYSQQTMTEYNSPYRFPALKAPPIPSPEIEPYREVGPAPRQTGLEIKQASRLELRPPEFVPAKAPGFEPASAKIKRRYGLN